MFTPVNQVRLTNVAVVRLKKGGQRFEVAAYPNTVEAWRERIETNLDEVLQSRSVFVNVSKGQVAKADVVEKCFPSMSPEQVLCDILQRGQLQVGEKEREAALGKIRREIATALAALSVNPTTMLPYPVTILEKAMRELHFKPDAKKPAKRQALELLERLKQTMPIERAKMRVKLDCKQAVYMALEAHVSVTESLSRVNDDLEAVVLIEPGSYRALDEAVQLGGGRVTVLSLAAQREAEDDDAVVPLAAPAVSSSAPSTEEAAPSAGPLDNEAAAGGKGPSKVSRRTQKTRADLSELMGVVEQDSSDEEWKKGKAKAKGKGKGKKR